MIDLSVALSEKAEFARIAEKAQALAGSTTSDDEVLLWKLCSALWDERPLSAQERQKLSENQILLIEDSLKRERVSIWLKEAVSKAVEESIISNPSPSFKLFSLLTGRQMGKAVQEAIKTKDFKLAMIVTQLGGAGSRLSVPNILPNSRIQSSAGHGVPGKNGTDEVVRECISSQVQIWKTMMNSSTTPLMDEDRFNCWVLCGGEFIKYSPEMFLRLSDWKRTWGLFLWYGDGGYWGLKESLKQYSEAILGGRSLIRQPLPGYIERAGSKRSELIKSKSKWMPRNETPLDCMFHLLRLYAENADYKLETVLRPETISGDCMDYRISWILLVFLNQVKKVGEFSDAQLARQQDAQVVVVPSAKNDLITTSLIHQLEVLGLWTWACFVALFLKSPMRREAVIRDLISRYFPLSDHSGSCYGMILQEESAVSTPPSPPSSVSTNALSTEWKFLVETLSIPPVWIFEAKVKK